MLPAKVVDFVVVHTMHSVMHTCRLYSYFSYTLQVHEPCQKGSSKVLLTLEILSIVTSGVWCGPVVNEYAFYSIPVILMTLNI